MKQPFSKPSQKQNLPILFFAIDTVVAVPEFTT
jgi:hypothetical protein